MMSKTRMGAIACVSLMIVGFFPLLASDESELGTTEPSEGRSLAFPSTYEFADRICLWTNRNQSDPGFPFPYSNQTPSIGMEFFRTNYINVPPLGQANGYTTTLLNDSSFIGPTTKIVVQMPNAGTLAGWVSSAAAIANEAKNNSRIIGLMWDDFSVGLQSPANMSAVYAAAHHEDVNLSQGPLKLFLVVYSYNYWKRNPYSWSQIDPYYDAVEFWYFPMGYGKEGAMLAGYEDAVRTFYAMNTSKSIWLGVYMHYYNAGYYPYEITYDLLSADARLISEGLAERITVIANFWIPNNPETAYLIRNFLANEMYANWASRWSWSTDDVVTTKNGVAASDAISGIVTKWAGNKTFYSHHHQNVSVVGFTGNNFTVQSVRTGEIISTVKSGTTWYFYASPNEEYKVCNWPRTPVVYNDRHYILTATSWNNLEVTINGWMRVNASFWVNNTIIRFRDPLYHDAFIFNISAPFVGLTSNLSNNPKIYLENSTIEPVERIFPFYFNTTWSATGTLKVFSIRNSTIACWAGSISFMGYTRVYDSVFYQAQPNAATYVGLKEYAPSTANEFRFVRNLVWSYNWPGALLFSFQPAGLNGSGTFTFTDNKLIGGRHGILTDGAFSGNTSYQNIAFGNTRNYDQQTTLWSPYWVLNSSTSGVDKQMWFFMKFSLKTDIPLSGTLKDADGDTIGIYSSSGGYINVSNILYAHYDATGTMNIRNPFPWAFNFTLPAITSFYFALADENKYAANRTSWEYPRYREMNGTTISIPMEQASSLHVVALDQKLWTGITNYVNASATLSFADTNHAQRKVNWTTPSQASLAAMTNLGTLKVWSVSYNPRATVSTAASWYADNNVLTATMSMRFTGLLASQKYFVMKDGASQTIIASDGSGTAVWTYTGGWSPHLFALVPYYEGGGPRPIGADFSYAVNGLKVIFTDKSTGIGINSWLWAFGDKSTSTNQDPTHTYPAVGSYRVTLVITTADGVTDSVTKTVVVSSTTSIDLGDTALMFMLAFMFAGLLIAIVSRRPSGALVGIVCVFIGIIIYLWA